MRRTLYLVILSWIFQFSAANEQVTFDLDAAKKNITQTLTFLDQRPHNKWQYTEVNERNTGKKNEIFEAQFNPTKTDQAGWTLISVNEKTPKKKQKKDFYKQKIKQQENASGDDLLLDIVNINSLKLEKQQQSLAYFSFEPRFADFSSKAEQALEGQLVYDWPTKQLKTISMKNVEDFSPAISVKMSRFFIEFTIDQFQTQSFVKQTRIDIKGKIAGIKNLVIKSDALLSEVTLP